MGLLAQLKSKRLAIYTNMYYCEKCQKFFERRKAYIGHCSSHSRGESYKLNRKKKIETSNYVLTGKHNCFYCNKEFKSGISLGGHTVRCVLNPNSKENIKKATHKCSKKTKEKLSIKRKEYLKNNPDKHPWKKNSKFKSPPCEKLIQILIDRGFIIQPEFKPLKDRFFSIDIAFIEKKIGIEVNGDQHYERNGKLKKYYQNRHDLITSNGWTLFEIPSKKVYNEDYIEKLIEKLL